jgi:predicted phosphoribosyltransferase
MEAGHRLTKELQNLSLENPIVLAIPRGGVIIGYEIASSLQTEFDIIVPRKIGTPGEPELAIGAVMHDGSLFLNEGALFSVTDKYLEAEKKRQVEEAQRRLKVYRGDNPYPKIQGRSAIVVDDGIATGATMIAAIRWIRGQKAKKVFIAVPVAPIETISTLRKEADKIICPYTPEPFYAIGQFYQEFGAVTDEEVIKLLKNFWSKRINMLGIKEI